MANQVGPIPRCLFGDGLAIVIGLPPGFDLCSAIKSASEIRLATAFAHLSGWKLISRAVQEGHASCRMVTGLDFCQTDPAVLRAWLALVRDRRAAARLYIGDGSTFHPKVLIVSNGKRRFAIVGSGNLSAGGFRDNVECSVFVNKKPLLDGLQSWFDDVFDDETATKALTNPDIKEYEPKFKQARRHSFAIKRSQRQVESKIGEKHGSQLLQWKVAVAEAKRYFKSAHFRSWYPDEKKAAVKQIKSALRYPEFRFSRQGWDAFFGIADLGRLRQTWKNSLWKQHTTVQRALRELVDESVPPERRLSAILDPGGEFRIEGIGRNIVSKVLAVHRPKVWPVYNHPVAETLDAFEYQLPRGMAASSRYLAFAEMMRKFMRESGAPDMLALDCFFFWYSRLRE